MESVKSVQAPAAWSILSDEIVRDLAMALQYIHAPSLVDVSLTINGITAQYSMNESGEVIFIPLAHQGKNVRLTVFSCDPPQSSSSHAINLPPAEPSTSTINECGSSFNTGTFPKHSMMNLHSVAPSSTSDLVLPLNASVLHADPMFCQRSMLPLDLPVPRFIPDYPQPEEFDAIYLSDESADSFADSFVHDNDMDWYPEVSELISNEVDVQTFNYIYEDIVSDGTVYLESDSSSNDTIFVSGDEEDNCIYID